MEKQKKCCTVDNLQQASSGGKLLDKVNVLVCKTCGYQDTFVYGEENENNALFSYIQYTETRVLAKLPLFSDRVLYGK